MASVQRHRVAILRRGDHEAGHTATSQNNRVNRVFEELEAVGIDAVPEVYPDDIVDEVRQQLLAVDGILVWVGPIHHGLTRAMLDAMLVTSPPPPVIVGTKVASV